ncbi:MAG: hypothetical protein ACRDGN_17825, partial [bacterium]
ASAFRGVCTFLGVDPTFRPNFDVYNANKEMRSRVIPRTIRALAPVRHLARVVLPKQVRGAGRGIAKAVARWNARFVPRPALRPELRRRLQDWFADDIHELQELIGRDLSGWLSPDARAADQAEARRT